MRLTAITPSDVRRFVAEVVAAPDRHLPMLYVQRQRGHSSIVTTQQEYGHLEESFLRDAPLRAEEAIWGPAMDHG
jgi:integrase